MNARFIALLLSCIVTTLPAYAIAELSLQPQKQAVIPVKININTADVAHLTGSFKGIGKKRAESIITYRETHHGFKSLQELAEVKGLGQRFVDKNIIKLNEVFIL